MKKNIFIAMFFSVFLVGCVVKDENYDLKSKNSIIKRAEQREALKASEIQNIKSDTKEEQQEIIELEIKKEIENKELEEKKIKEKEAEDKIEQDKIKAIKKSESLKINCENGSKESCMQYGNYLYDQDDYIGAASVYNATCSHFQHIQACMKLASMFENGIGIEKNLVVAKDIYTRACYSGNSFGCKKMKSMK